MVKANLQLHVRARVYDDPELKKKYDEKDLVFDTDWVASQIIDKTSFELRAVQRDEMGEEVWSTPWKPSESFVIQFLEIIHAYLSFISRDITTVANEEDEWTRESEPRANAVSGDTTKGIVVGTGSTAVTNTDYKMETKIAHGSGAGQLLYSSMSWSQPCEVGAELRLVAARSFTNDSGSTVTIQEVGIEVEEYNTSKDRLIAHDLLTVAIPYTETRSVEYRITTEAPGFVKNFLWIHYINLGESAVGFINLTDITNTGRLWSPSHVMIGSAGSGNDDRGIVVGTGTTTPTNDDYKLGTQIVHGVGSGQLSYGEQMTTTPAEIGNNVDFVLTRNYTNGSGAEVVIKEIGYYVTQETTGYFHCIAHNLLTVAVPDEMSTTIEYRMRTTV